MTTAWDTAYEAWEDEAWRRYRAAEEATRGNLLRKDHWMEFDRKHGVESVYRVLFLSGSSTLAYRYASEELRRWWAYHPRTTWPEFAVQAGITYRHVVKAARQAPGARQAASMRAESRTTGRWAA